jgi:tetratricopeptide (TPR) repeat protein
VLSVLLVAMALSESKPADLAAAAAASGRPPECWPERRSELGGEASVWARARRPGLDRYCDLLARSHARVVESPAAARAAALEALRLEPGRAAPHVVLGRVAARLGKLDEALREFDRAEAIDSRSVEQPIALHDKATVLRQAAELGRALDAYRLLVPRSALVPSRSWRARVLLEAAHTSMAVAAASAGPGGDKSPALDEALAYLREAGEDSHHELRLDTALSLVLVLDRAGRGAQADAVLGEVGSSAGWAEHPQPTYLGRPVDWVALQALALERSSPRAAAALWKRYLEQDRTSPEAWKQAARLRQERLERRAGARPATERGSTPRTRKARP